MNQMTNEQQVVDIERQLTSLKSNYMDYLRNSILNTNTTGLKELLELQKIGNEYFNHAEQFVGNSGLLGAHTNGKWVTGFAETCYSILEAYIEHMKLLRGKARQYGLDVPIEPNIHAYANMQRMVVEYLPRKQSKKLEKEFIKNDLPIHGFEYKGAENMEKRSQWREIVGVILGTIGMIAIIVLVLFNPELSEKQFLIVRGLFALCSAMLVILIPGALNVQSNWNKMSVKATGAIAVFIIIWMLNPPSLV